MKNYFCYTIIYYTIVENVFNENHKLQVCIHLQFLKHINYSVYLSQGKEKPT